jgi:hypothetical protein
MLNRSSIFAFAAIAALGTAGANPSSAFAGFWSSIAKDGAKAAEHAAPFAEGAGRIGREGRGRETPQVELGKKSFEALHRSHRKEQEQEQEQ